MAKKAHDAECGFRFLFVSSVKIEEPLLTVKTRKKKKLNVPESELSLTTFKFQKLGSSWSVFGSVIYLIMRENL